MSDLFGNPEDRFSRVAAHLSSRCVIYLCVTLFLIKTHELLTRAHSSMLKCVTHAYTVLFFFLYFLYEFDSIFHDLN